VRKLSTLLLLLILIGCQEPALVDEFDQVDSHEWVFDDARQWEVEVTDTLTPHNFYVQVRHGGNYAYQNLIVYFKTYFPNNTFKIDTIDCPMADPTGRWYGSGLGDLVDNQIMFKRNIQFPFSGNYKFELQHAMRPDTIHEIYDVGLLIEVVSD